MPYDPGLAERLEALLSHRRGMQQKTMFGGIGWMLHGHMCVGIYKDFLILRVGETAAKALLKKRHVGPMDITGKPMKGWLMVAPKGYEGDAALGDLVRNAAAFVETLPSKD